MALATIPIKGTDVGSGLFWATNNVQNVVSQNHRVYIGYLYTGTTDVTALQESPEELGGISHPSRPVSLSFDYKYIPYNGDRYSVCAKLYDSMKNEIASLNLESSNNQDSYKTETINFKYLNLNTQVAYLYIIFKSGINETWDDVKYIKGSYDANPWSLDTFVGSVLKIDNVKLNYDYE